MRILKFMAVSPLLHAVVSLSMILTSLSGLFPLLGVSSFLLGMQFQKMLSGIGLVCLAGFG